MDPPSSKSSSCSLCRRRKTRCDGQSPCGRCRRARKPVTCVYGLTTSIPPLPPRADSLPKGAACIRCRCSGTIPCRTCTKARPPSECKHDETTPGRGMYPETPPSLQTAPKNPHLSQHDATDIPDLFAPSESCWPSESTFGAYDPYLISLDCAPFYPQLCSDFPPDFVNAARPDSTYSMSVANEPLDLAETLATTPSIMEPAPLIIRNPVLEPPPAHIIELFNVRTRFLQDGWHHGLKITDSKWSAFIRGDQSCIVVRSTLVNMCQVMGCLRTAHVHRGPWIYETGETLPEEDQVAVILGSLSAGPDPLTRLKGFLCLATYHIERGDVSGFEGFLAQAGRVVAENVVALGLDEDQLFSEHSGSSDAEDLAPHGLLNESRAALSQLVWTDIVRSLFTRMAHANGTCTDVVFMRAKSAVFLVESQALAAEWNTSQSSADTFPAEWSRSYWGLIDDIYAHMKLMNSCWAQVQAIPQLQLVHPTLKAAMIVALTAMVELFGVLAPSLAESTRQHRGAMNTVFKIASTFSEPAYCNRDPALAVCLAIARRPIGKWDTASVVNGWEPR
ncbi:hypothetical protein C8J57DRAFT_1330388 [Mycena rebaudengoi]|nr:hypothetical protein C8J57DRAFT_1330388 [Mycena rebaudengoi]